MRKIVTAYGALGRNRIQTLHKSVSRCIQKKIGNIDAKMVSSSDVRQMRMEAISGPAHEGLPLFEWKGRWAANNFHHGQPLSFGFSWVTF